MSFIEESVEVGKQLISHAQCIDGCIPDRLPQIQLLRLLIDGIVIAGERIECSYFYPASTQLFSSVKDESTDISSHHGDAEETEVHDAHDGRLQIVPGGTYNDDSDEHDDGDDHGDDFVMMSMSMSMRNEVCYVSSYGVDQDSSDDDDDRDDDIDAEDDDGWR